MYLVDFIYDGQKLSNLGCMVGSVNTDNNMEIDAGSEINLTTVLNHGSSVMEIVNAEYSNAYSCTFDIIRKPCGGFEESFSDREISWFMRWLNKKEYHKFVPLYQDGHSFNNVFMMGTFTSIKLININGKIVGFTVNFVSNSPFSYGEEKVREFRYSSDNKSEIKYDESRRKYYFDIKNTSDELGHVYPDRLVLDLAEPDDPAIGNTFEFYNSLEPNRKTIVSNMPNTNEKITFDCIHKIVECSNHYIDFYTNKPTGAHSTFYKDFNYVYPRLVNNTRENLNRFYFNIRCYSVEFHYNPIRKVGALV